MADSDNKAVSQARRWPADFLWGTGASSTQCEGAAPASDWFAWEQAGHAPLSGAGNGFSHRYAEDFSLLSGLGLRHHRLSIEWARIEPEEGQHDARAIAQYRRVLEAAHDAGILVWVCLHHFTLPRWFAERGGFLPGNDWSTAWARHVDFIAETFGDLVFGWQPVNETNYYATAAYLGRGWPPGHKNFGEWSSASQAIQLATAEAAVRLKQTGAPVASIFGLSTIVSLDELESTRRFVDFFYDSNWSAGLGLFRDGVLRAVGQAPLERPDLAGAFDLIGFSYYCAFGVRDGKLVPYPPERPRSALGYAIWADGLRLVLDRLHAEVPGVPLLVAEYGIGTDDDTLRSEYLEAGLSTVHEAIGCGIDIRGFFHWTAVDNYEWQHGYDVKFGIIDRERSVRGSAAVLKHAAGR